LGLDREAGIVTESDRPDLAQFQCNGALSAAKAAGRNPRELAQDVIDAFGETAMLEPLTIAGPGFININLTDQALADQLNEEDERFDAPAAEARAVLVDFGGPNVAKAMHVGHLRSTIIGDSMQRMMRFAGHDVLTDIHVGDWGTQMGQLIIEVERRMPELVYFDDAYSGEYPEESPVTLDDLQEMYPAVAARCKEDAEEAERARQATLELQQGRPGYRALWNHFAKVSQVSQGRDFEDLGVKFDLWHGESTVHDRVGPLIEGLISAGVASDSDGALVVEVAEPGDTKEIPPLILSKSDGAYLYTTTDVATIEARVQELHRDLILYVVDARQALHFEQVFRAARRAGVAPSGVELEHVGFGTMNDKNGKPFKTREGGILKLKDLIDMVSDAARARLDEAGMAADYEEAERNEIARRVGLAALKYGDLSNHRMSNYVFDLDRFTSFEGKTGPYLLYGAVRMTSILRKAGEQGFEPGRIVPPIDEADRNLMLQILRFPNVFDRAISQRAPNHLAEYAFELVATYSRFYESHHILSEADEHLRQSWLRLVAMSLALIALLLDLLGIQIPERM
ncbi:MAG: arginine--tRNA ligase, partial [Acidimicrobiia bacterium]|nr:arginine--tRNA ligase [Acidimicrobiia bacterium]